MTKSDGTVSSTSLVFRLWRVLWEAYKTIGGERKRKLLNSLTSLYTYKLRGGRQYYAWKNIKTVVTESLTLWKGIVTNWSPKERYIERNPLFTIKFVSTYTHMSWDYKWGGRKP